MEKEKLKNIYLQKWLNSYSSSVDKENYNFIKYLFFSLKFYIKEIINFWKKDKSVLSKEYKALLLITFKSICFLQNRLGIFKDFSEEEKYSKKLEKFIFKFYKESEEKDYIDEFNNYTKLDEEFMLAHEGIIIIIEILKSEYNIFFKFFLYDNSFEGLYKALNKYYLMYEEEILMIKEKKHYKKAP